MAEGRGGGLNGPCAEVSLDFQNASLGVTCFVWCGVSKKNERIRKSWFKCHCFRPSLQHVTVPVVTESVGETCLLHRRCKKIVVPCIAYSVSLTPGKAMNLPRNGISAWQPPLGHYSSKLPTL